MNPVGGCYQSKADHQLHTRIMSKIQITTLYAHNIAQVTTKLLAHNIAEDCDRYLKLTLVWDVRACVQHLLLKT
jgi:hypothetical protein